MKKFYTAFSFVLCMILASLSIATPASAQKGAYFGVFGGYTFGADASRWYDEYDYYYYDDDDIDVDDTWAVGFKIGYAPPMLRFAAFEFEYSYFNPDMDRTLWNYRTRNYASIEGDVEFNNFMFNAKFAYPAGRFHPYAGGGIGFSYMDASGSSTATGRSFSDDDTVFAWQVMCGIEIDLTHFLSLDIGYRYFSTESDSDHDDYYYYHDDDYYDDDDNSGLDYETSMVTVGVNFKF